MRFIGVSELNANNEDLDQTSHSAASDLGPHCLPMSLLWDATQPAFFINLQRAVIGPSATLTGRKRPAIDLCRMLTG